MPSMTRAQAPILPIPGRAVVEVWLRLPAVWRERRALRRTLARMDGRLWDDLGLDPAAVRAEIARPFWRGSAWTDPAG